VSHKQLAAGLWLAVLVVMPCAATAQDEETAAGAWVTCVSEPSGARVLMSHPMSADTWEKGTTPARIPIFDIGPIPREIRVTLVKPGYEPYTTVVSLSQGEEVRVQAELAPRRMMAYVSDAKIVIANADGSVPTEVAGLEQPVSWEYPAWFPDARSLCVWQAGELWRFTPDGESLGRLAGPPEAAVATGTARPLALSSARVLASGRWVVFLGGSGEGPGSLFIAPSEPGGACAVVAGEVRRVSVSPTSDVLAAITAEGATLLAIDASGEVTPAGRIPRASEVAWSPDGTLVAVALDGEIYVGDSGLAELAQVTESGKAGMSDLVWTPDGTGILCTIHRELTRRSQWDEIWLLHAPGSNGDPYLVVDGRVHPFSPDLAPLAMIPYSTRLAYRSGSPPNHRTYAVDLRAPAGPETLLFNSGLPAWSAPIAEPVGPQPGQEREPVRTPADEMAGMSIEE